MSEAIGRVTLENVRLAFFSGFEAKQVNGEGKPAFSTTALFPPTHPAVAKIKAAQLAVGNAKWGEKAPSVLKALAAADKLALHNGATKESYDGFEGMLFVSCRSGQRPLILDRDKTPLTASDGKPYSGCYANVGVEFWAQDNQYGKRINTSLRWVQFVKDGDSFGGGGSPASADEVPDLGVDETEASADDSEFDPLS